MVADQKRWIGADEPQYHDDNDHSRRSMESDPSTEMVQSDAHRDQTAKGDQDHDSRPGPQVGAATEYGLVTESIDRNSTPQEVAALIGPTGDRAQPTSRLLVNATPLPRRELPIPYLAFIDLPVILDDTRDFEGLNGFEATIIQFSRQASLYTSMQLDEAFVADLVRIVFQD